MKSSNFYIKEFEKQSLDILEKYFPEKDHKEQVKAINVYAGIMLLVRNMFRKQHEEILKKLPKEKKREVHGHELCPECVKEGFNQCLKEALSS